jgi:hypothetical protein
MVNGISQGTGNSLFDMLRSMQKEQEEILGENLTSQALETVKAQPLSASVSSSSNMMSQNFASAEREESKYIKARQTGQEAVNKQSSRQMAILTAGMASLDTIDSDNYALRSLNGQKAARRMHEEGQQTVREESEKNLKEIRENIEEKAQEAAVPTDANGNPIEGLPTIGSGEAALMPEIFGSSPAPDVSAAPTPDVAAVPAPEIATSAPAPSAPSIDIRV